MLNTVLWARKKNIRFTLADILPLQIYLLFRQGQDFGDEYFAELDMIESVEGRKEGYESDVEDGKCASVVIILTIPWRNLDYKSSNICLDVI